MDKLTCPTEISLSHAMHWLKQRIADSECFCANLSPDKTKWSDYDHFTHNTIQAEKVIYAALQDYQKSCPRPESKPLTVEELQETEGEPLYVVVLDKTVFADKDDAINGWGLVRKSWVRMWDKDMADLVHIDHDFEDYGETWLAYRRKPEEK